MSLAMYQASVPVLARALESLEAILDKAAAHAEANKIEPAALTEARLFPDMYKLARQVQIATSIAKNCATRLAGIDLPKVPDEEITFADLKVRCRTTVEFLKSLKPEQFDGSENREIAISAPDRKFNFRGDSYLLEWVLPHFYFHVTAAYCILRHNGVKLGKWDFLGV